MKTILVIRIIPNSYKTRRNQKHDQTQSKKYGQICETDQQNMENI